MRIEIPDDLVQATEAALRDAVRRLDKAGDFPEDYRDSLGQLAKALHVLGAQQRCGIARFRAH